MSRILLAAAEWTQKRPSLGDQCKLIGRGHRMPEELTDWQTDKLALV